MEKRKLTKEEEEITVKFFGELLMLMGHAVIKDETKEQYCANIDAFVEKYSKYECTQELLHDMEQQLAEMEKEAAEATS